MMIHFESFNKYKLASLTFFTLPDCLPLCSDLSQLFRLVNLGLLCLQHRHHLRRRPSVLH